MEVMCWWKATGGKPSGPWPCCGPVAREVIPGPPIKEAPILATISRFGSLARAPRCLASLIRSAIAWFIFNLRNEVATVAIGLGFEALAENLQAAKR